MKAPKETVRRRLSRLVDRGLVTMTKGGAMLGKVDVWVYVASRIAS
jgi:DeoR/GlpR family transcriptional regulator of sugar metabolism